MSAAPAHVVIGMFGITRSLRFTRDSIQRNILNPLRAAGLPFRLFGHFHMPETISNPRTGEHGLPADRTETDCLPFDRLATEPQDESLIADRFGAASARPDLLQDGYASVRNLCFQLRSLQRLWSLIEEAGETASWVLFARPDLRYLDPVRIPELAASMRLTGAQIAIPPWHGWGGCNDRFALASPEAARAYANRGALLAAHLETNSTLHAETLLRHALQDAGLRIAPLPVRALRIRAGGWAEKRDMAEFGLVAASAIGPAALRFPPDLMVK